MGCGASAATGRNAAIPEDPKAQEMRLKAQESQKRLEAMMAEVQAEKDKVKASFMSGADPKVIAALQRLWYGACIEVSKHAQRPKSSSAACNPPAIARLMLACLHLWWRASKHSGAQWLHL